METTTVPDASQQAPAKGFRKATFRAIPDRIALTLLDFTSKKNLGKTITIEDKIYTLEHISTSSNAFFRSRGLSVYLKTARSMVRISDHWAESIGNERSRKLNCGSISGKFWTIGPGADRLEYHGLGCGKYPWILLAGICGLSSLNKTCTHFMPEKGESR